MPLQPRIYLEDQRAAFIDLLSINLRVDGPGILDPLAQTFQNLKFRSLNVKVYKFKRGAFQPVEFELQCNRLKN